MCGIVGVVSHREVAGILLEGLRRLEYRGYDSAGIALLNKDAQLNRLRRQGKVAELCRACHANMPEGKIGIAHTRWATHGEPSETNAHPHTSGDLAVVHNGIIENHEPLREALIKQGFQFETDTDTEVIAHQLNYELTQTSDLLEAMNVMLRKLEGAYALAIIHKEHPDRLMLARQGSTLVIGIGEGEHYVASDPGALRHLAERFIFLEDGEIAEITEQDYTLFKNKKALRKNKQMEDRIIALDRHHDIADKGEYRHYMLKEIYEQPEAVERTLSGRLSSKHALAQAFGAGAEGAFAAVRAVQITACGSSYYAGLVAKYWFEEYAKVPCQVEIASELRYRQNVVLDGTLFVALSQSGETADTLAALRNAKDPNYVARLCLCNVPNSTLIREADLSMLLEAGSEICVASTKAFTNQLVDLLMLVAVIGKMNGLAEADHEKLVSALRQLPHLIRETLKLEPEIKHIAESFVDKHNALFLGRGIHYPIALEGALKLKEISYIHAEGYQAGELKHGPLALVDDDMPVVAIAPGGALIEKLKSNLEEVRARGAALFVLADERNKITRQADTRVLKVPSCPAAISPMLYTLPVQLLAYHVAVLKGTDIDQPRNLAKSVTVE